MTRWGMADFDDPSVEAFIQSFREQLNDEENWPDVARELGLPPQADGGQPASGAASAPGAAFGLPAAGVPAGSTEGVARRFFTPPPPRPQVTLPPARDGVRLLTVRVDVDEVKPAVWRRIEVRSDVTMAQFHDVIQATLGWADAHLHRFTLGPKKDVWRGPFLASVADVEMGDDLDEASGVETEVVLDQVLRAPGDRVFYVYDFGDDWVHTIKVEKVVELATSGTPDADGPLAECVAGRNACPLEDSGGPWQYNELVQGHKARNLSPEYAEWVPPGWDPARFSVDEANAAIVVLSKENEALQRIAEEGAVDPSSMLGQTLRRASPRAQVVLLGSVSRARKEHVEPTDAERADALRSWVTLIGMLAEGPLPLTQAGYLKPDTVGRIVDALGIWTHGSSRREMDVVPVTALRESLKTMGYARHYRGEFVLTKRGQLVAKAIAAGELEQLWRDLAAALVPAKADEFEACARTLYALLVASAFPQEHTYEMIRELIADVGWRMPDGSPPRWRDIGPCVWPMMRMLEHVEQDWCLRRSGQDYTPAARALAFDAVAELADTSGTQRNPG